jgi:uncharacterized membrane protein
LTAIGSLAKIVTRLSQWERVSVQVFVWVNERRRVHDALGALVLLVAFGGLVVGRPYAISWASFVAGWWFHFGLQVAKHNKQTRLWALIAAYWTVFAIVMVAFVR